MEAIGMTEKQLKTFLINLLEYIRNAKSKDDIIKHLQDLKQIIDAILKSIIKALKDGVQKEKIIEYLEHFLS